MIFAVLCFTVASDAAACYSDNLANAGPGEFNSDTNDFTLILRDAQDWNCYAQAKDKLETKMSLIASQDPIYWKRWFAGGPLTQALASALAISTTSAFAGSYLDLGSNLDKLLRDAANNYERLLQTNDGTPTGTTVCGGTNLWNGGNTCLEDYAMGASAWGWITAYRRLTGRDWTSARTKTLDEMKLTLAANTSCIRYNGVRGPDPVKGACNGTLSELTAGTASIISLNHGMQTPSYGVGQMTSISVGFVGLDVAEAPVLTTEIPAEQKTVAQALWKEGQAKIGAPGDWDAVTCYQVNGSGGFNSTLVPCHDTTFWNPANDSPYGNGQSSYRADMFPVYDFYQRYGLMPSNPPGSYLFQTFRSQTFFDTGNHMWGPARKDYYGTQANTWVTYKPWMSGRKERAGGIKRGSYYLSAATNSALQAVYTSRQTHGHFIIENVDNGYLTHGTQVAVKNYQGYYLTWGGPTVTASGTSIGPNQTFTIEKITDYTVGPIAHGDSFALRTSTNKYLRIPPGGNADTTATAIGSYETMVLERTNNELLD